MLWYGKPVAEKIEEELKYFFSQDTFADKYIAIIMLGADHPGAAYVRAKEKFAQRIGLSTKIIGNEDRIWTEIDIIRMIQQCNDDDACVGVMVQLPLPMDLESSKQKILDTIARQKDIDALSSWHQSRMLLLPATPIAVLALIRYYHYDLTGKKIAILGNSNLIGKPLAFALENRELNVKVFTVESNQAEMKKYCRDEADVIISATGHIHLVDETFVRNDQSQVVIDVGRGYHNDKAVGDTLWEILEHSTFAITPVPGGVGPVTVASLFSNIITLQAIQMSFGE